MRASVSVRVLLVVILSTGVASAGNNHACSLHDTATLVTDLGCFETFHRDEHDNVIGQRVCLVHTEPGGCRGTLVDVWGSPVRFEPQILARVTCGASDGAITFRHTWVSFTLSGERVETVLTFKGALEGDRLRGTYGHWDGTKRVVWKRTRKTRDTVGLLRRATARSCANKSAS